MEIMKKAAELGFLGVIFPEEYGGAGLGYVEYVLVVSELSQDRSVGRHLGRGAQLAVHQSHLQVRQRRAASPLGDAARPRREDRRLGADRSGLGLGCRRRPDDRAQGRRRLGPRRRQGLLHPRLGGRCLRRDGGDRSRGRSRPQHVGLRDRKGHEGIPLRQEGEQARHPRVGHRGGDLRGVLRARREPAGRAGRGIQAGDGGARRRAHLDRRARPGHGASAPTRRRSPTPRSASSSGARSPSSRRSASPSRRWRPRSPPRRRSPSPPPPRWTGPARSPSRPRRRSC